MQDCDLTLKEAIEEFRCYIDEPIGVNSISSEAAKLFQSHDATHVLFGHDSSINQEALNDLVTIMCTTMNLFKYVAYLKLPEARMAFKGVSTSNFLVATVYTLQRFPEVIKISRAMKKKWPWNFRLEYLDIPLNQLRKKYGIYLKQID